MSNLRASSIVRWLAVSLVLVAGPAGSLDEYLVIVNRGEGEVMVSYRAGVFQGPNMEAIAMLNTPMQAPAESYDKIKKSVVDILENKKQTVGTSKVPQKNR